jgi:septum site-determining protein MinD
MYIEKQPYAGLLFSLFLLFRQTPSENVRTNFAILFARKENGMARKIVITSGKGGVGKTTLTALLGVALAQKGERVALVDADFGLNNLDLYLGLEGCGGYAIPDVLAGRCRVKQALVKHPKYPTLSLLCGGTEPFFLGAERFQGLLAQLEGEFDYLLIDSPAGVGDGFLLAASAADEGVVVVAPQLSSVRDADKAIQRLKGAGVQTLSLFINGSHGDLVVSGEEFSPIEIAKLLKLPVLGVMPYVYALSCENLPLTHTAVRYAAELLRGGKRRVYDPTKRYSGLFGSIRRGLKRSL